MWYMISSQDIENSLENVYLFVLNILARLQV